MNSPKSETQPPMKRGLKAARKRSGLALIIVLEMLVLVVLLVIAFLSSVSIELNSAKQYSSGVDARSLADSAVNLVIAQIQDATTTPQLAWASQPGMVRTYDSDGQPVTAYKLYSSSPLRVDGGFNARGNQATEVPADWASQAALYTDLNQPVAVNGVNHYPIIDPSAVAASVSGGTVLEGEDPPIEGAYLDVNNPAVSVSGAQTNRVPMPVQWMYILADGKLAAMTPGTTTVPDASTGNPIVGRVAFWADDETSKVNINTASEGAYWDRPFADGDPSEGFERLLSTNMPVSGEYQRYPGHPAMTSLSTIFPPLVGEPDVTYRERIYSIIPRINGGGSLGGTVKVDKNALPIIPDAQRLYASVDEMMFQGTFPGSGPREVNVKGTGNQFSQDDLDRTRFFLTASSRAPEVNMFNKPRIALWPLQANTASVGNPEAAADRNAADKLIAFCSTVGGTPYYFQRYNSFNRALDRTLGPTQNPMPSSQSPSMDWDEIPRNQELYAYLRSLTSENIPGLGGKLAGAGGKYTASARDQILTQMVDYLRSGVNTFSTKTEPAYTYVPFPKDTSGWITGQNQVVPLVIDAPSAKTKGFGRFSTVTQASLVFYRMDKWHYREPPPSVKTPEVISDDVIVPVGSEFLEMYPEDGVPQMGVVLLLQTFNPTPGAPPWSGNVRYVVEGLDGIAVNDVPLDFPQQAINLVTAQEGYYDATALSGMELATNYWPKNRKKLGITSVGANDEEQFYPFFTSPVSVPGPTFKLTGAQIRIKIYQGYSNELLLKDLVQTINMDFPDADALPIPNVRPPGKSNVVVDSEPKWKLSTDNEWTNYNSRLAHPGVDQGGQHNNKPLIVAPGAERPPYGTVGDVVRSVQARYLGPALGDFRVIAALHDVPSILFEGKGQLDPITDQKGSIVLDYNSPTRVLHSLRTYPSVGNEQTQKKNGFFQGSGLTDANAYKHAKLVEAADVLDVNPNGGWRPNRAPVAPQGMTGAYMNAAKTLPGDWDTGPGTQIDGPYINKADEGNSNIGYYNTGANTTAGTIIETGASFAPNRQMASAVTFGSLPSGIDPGNINATQPWRTLLFTKHPAAGDEHPGFGKPLSGPPYNEPPDHAFLDFFTMPIVEPYAISEPFSTAGKVNMNYEMVPFTYMKRTTGVRAVLKSAKMMAIPTEAGLNYKSGSKVDSSSTFTLTPPPSFRHEINPDEVRGTLAGFEKRFSKGDIFRSASEICDISLVPGKTTDGVPPVSNPAYDDMASWWRGNNIHSKDGHKLTGDNVRENPYNSIYPRLTTKSNTYTVHVRAQALQKAKGTAANQFVEGRDLVTSEYRGSFLVERYLDPNSDTLVKADGKTPANELDADAMVGPYKFRTVSTKRFAP